MDGLAESAVVAQTRQPPALAPAARPAPGPTVEGVLSFDMNMRAGFISGRAGTLLGLSRNARQAQGLAELLASSPRIDADAAAALMAACFHATLPDNAGDADLHLPGAPGLRFGIRRASAGSWVLSILDDQTLPGGGGFDQQTGLADRAMFEARLAAALSRPNRRRAGGGVLLCDLDGIREVNQMLGHAVGEDLVRAAARRLQAALREGDLVARMAGEEFAILQNDVTDPDRAAALAERLVGLLSRPYLIRGETVVVRPRIGVALAPADGTEAELLLRRAGLAQREVAAEGQGAWRRFTLEMDERWQETRTLEAALRLAIAEGQFELFFQPLIALPACRLTGFEALIRWRHPERGVLPPASFLPAAERIGLMGPMGDWVMAEACRMAATWPAELQVAVNIAPAQFESGRLPETVARALQQSGLEPGRLELEVTESVLLAASDLALHQLRALRERGVRIAMDDFGTGHSSLTQLRAFPFDRLKIDRSFVKDLEAGGDAAAIVRAVAGLGRSLGIAVTAEGVETDAQLGHILAEGCDAAQGYLFGRPVEAAQVPDVVQRFAAMVPP